MGIRFYTDTHIAKQVAVQLQAKGIDAIRCEDVGMAEADAEYYDLILTGVGQISDIENEFFDIC